MIELKRYITNNTSKNIMIENELELHFYVEYVLGESFDYSYFNIFEKHGSYIGQKELIIDLSKEIYNIIRNHEPEDTIKISGDDLKNYNNIFFDELIIYFYGKTGYNSSKSKYIESKKLFDKVVININSDEYNEYEDIVKCLTHEMLHAYNEYKNYISNSKFKLSELTNKNSTYYKTIFNSSILVKDICKRICNNIRKWEQNSYISELSVELENKKFDISKYNTTDVAYKEAYEIFINSDVWIQYSTLWTYLKSLNNSDENDKKEMFKNEYNNINNTSLSFNKIYNKLDSVFEKIFKKIKSVIPKIFYDYYKEQIKESINERKNQSLIKFIQYVNEYNLLESVKQKNGKDWEVYVNNKLDNTFTKWSKKWKKQPKIGHGWYAGGTVFKVVKIEDNKVYTEEDKTIKP